MGGKDEERGGEGLGEEEAWAVSAEQGDLLLRDPPLLCVRHIWGASEPSAVR